MSDEQEQERDGYPEATTIGPNVNAAQLELDIDAISRRTRKFIVEQQNTIDRLTAERDAARAEVERLRAALTGPIKTYLAPNVMGLINHAADVCDDEWEDCETAKGLRLAHAALRAALETEADHD